MVMRREPEDLVREVLLECVRIIAITVLWHVAKKRFEVCTSAIEHRLLEATLSVQSL